MFRIFNNDNNLQKKNTSSKKEILNLNENINKEIDKIINLNYAEICNKLISRGCSDEEINNFIDRYRRDMQVKLFEEFNKRLELEVKTASTTHKN